jgi:hypothetical protein
MLKILLATLALACLSLGCGNKSSVGKEPISEPRPVPQLYVCQCDEICDDAMSRMSTLQQVVCANADSAVETAEQFCALRADCPFCSCTCMGPYTCE